MVIEDVDNPNNLDSKKIKLRQYPEYPYRPESQYYYEFDWNVVGNANSKTVTLTVNTYNLIEQSKTDQSLTKTTTSSMTNINISFPLNDDL